MLMPESITDDTCPLVTPAMSAYLNLARLGRNGWLRSLLAVLLILFMWQIIGSLPGAVLVVRAALTGRPSAVNPTGALPGVGMLAGFVALMLASVLFMAGIFLAMRFVHQRSVRTLITPARTIAWQRVLQGFGAWFLLAGLMAVLEARLYPGRYILTWDPGQFIPFAVLALILIPIQTSAEELFFRAYILQGLGLRLRNIWILCIISGVLFGLPHLLNPEASVNFPLLGLYYFAFGFSLAYITLRDGRLELALGAHAANNLFSVLIANTTVTALPSPSLFTINVLDAVYAVPTVLIGMGIFMWIFIGPLKGKIVV